MIETTTRTTMRTAGAEEEAEAEITTTMTTAGVEVEAGAEAKITTTMTGVEDEEEVGQEGTSTSRMTEEETRTTAATLITKKIEGAMAEVGTTISDLVITEDIPLCKI